MLGNDVKTIHLEMWEAKQMLVEIDESLGIGGSIPPSYLYTTNPLLMEMRTILKEKDNEK